MNPGPLETKSANFLTEMINAQYGRNESITKMGNVHKAVHQKRVRIFRLEILST
jgi:hypothetical protein